MAHSFRLKLHRKLKPKVYNAYFKWFLTIAGQYSVILCSIYHPCSTRKCFTDRVTLPHLSALHNDALRPEKGLSQGRWITDGEILKKQSRRAVPEKQGIWETVKHLSLDLRGLLGRTAVSGLTCFNVAGKC